MAKHLKLLALFSLVVVITLIALYFHELKTKQTVSLTPVSLPITTQAAPNTTTQESSDGSAFLTMKEEKTKNAQTIFTFSVSGKTVYTKTLDKDETFAIPFNTFSPDSKYFFLKETGKNGVSYIALTASGDPINKEDRVINFSDLFAQKLPDYKITDVTGWASPTLIVINTNKNDGSQGPSFWFEIPSKSFLILSTRFN